jgi:hypothetical protein
MQSVAGMLDTWRVEYDPDANTIGPLERNEYGANERFCDETGEETCGCSKRGAFGRGRGHCMIWKPTNCKLKVKVGPETILVLSDYNLIR